MTILPKPVADALLACGFVSEPHVAEHLEFVECWRVPGEDRYLNVLLLGARHYVEIDWKVSDQLGWLCRDRMIDAADLPAIILTIGS